MTCDKCPKRETCKELCSEMERLLERKGDRLYSDRWIRAKEVPYAPEHFDEFLPLQAIERVKGRRKLPTKTYPEDNY